MLDYRDHSSRIFETQIRDHVLSSSEIEEWRDGEKNKSSEARGGEEIASRILKLQTTCGASPQRASALI